MNSKREVIYLDLLDDAIYHRSDPAFIDQSPALQCLRIQTMLSVLFGKQISVPEQWIISSPAFHSLATEVIEGYERVRQRYVYGASRVSSLNRLESHCPFRFAFYEASIGTSIDPFVDAIYRRAESGSALRFSDVFQTDDESRKSLTSALNTRRRSAYYRPLYENDLPRILGRVNTIQGLHDKGEVDKKHKNNIQFVEACKDSTKSFQPSKQSLYFISLFIQLLVVLPRPQPIAFRWHNGLHPQIDYQLPGLIAFVGLVHDDLSPVPAIVFKGFQ